MALGAGEQGIRTGLGAEGRPERRSEAPLTESRVAVGCRGLAGEPASVLLKRLCRNGSRRVELRLLPGALVRGARIAVLPETLVALDGGQGTVNVPPWSPDSRWFAYCDYPVR